MRGLAEANSREPDAAVAVIGMACRLPGAHDYVEFWQNLREGRVSISEIPIDRWNWREYFGESRPDANTTLANKAGFIDDVDAFDADFFGISRLEAEMMDPQQRIILELAWQVLEDAAIRPGELGGHKVGVYIGAWGFDYKELLERGARTIAAHHATGTSGTLIANRVSFYFDFAGPSVTVDTACSSSLSAIHEASQALAHGECELALAGGVNLLLTPTRHLALSKNRMLSPTGSIKSFDDAADGYVRAEGAGVLLLKPLQRARADGDPIHAVIRGSATNHGGRVYTLTAPKAERQADAILEAYRRANIEPATIGYIEAHGTGTPKGDPIEMDGLIRAFARMRGAPLPNVAPFCGIGSAKPNIGHLEAAAGVAGLIKVVLSMKHGELPPLPHFQRVNRRISLENTPFFIADRRQSWRPLQGTDQKLLPRRAGVSGFGFGGTNAHIVIEEFLDDYSSSAPRPSDDVAECEQLIVLSAKSERSLRNNVDALVEFLVREPALEGERLEDLAFTLQVGREGFEHRIAFPARSCTELLEKLSALRKGETFVSCAAGRAPREALAKNSTERAPLLDQALARWRDQPESVEALAEVGRLWVAGHEVPWTALHPRRKPVRIHVPTYKFAKDRFWIPGEPFGAGEAAATVSVTGEPDVKTLESPELHLYREVWVPRPLPAAEVEREEGGLLVAFGLPHQDGVALRSNVTTGSPGTRVVLVERGPKWAEIEGECFQLPWFDEVAHDRLWRTVPARNAGLNVIYAGQNDEDWGGIRGVHAFLRALNRAALPLRRLVLVAPFCQGSSPASNLSWIGFRQSLRHVLPGVRVTMLYHGTGRPTPETIWRELGSGGIVRYDDTGRYELEAEAASATSETEVPLVQNGIYLITGGAGKLGQLFAAYLAERFHASLVLTGRRCADDAIEKTKASLQRLGAISVEYVSIDVTDGAGMASLFRQLGQRSDRLRGIIHAAGAEGTKPLEEMPWQEFYGVLAPKIEGTQILDRVTADLDLDFVSYVSSTAAVLGDLGGCAYAVANRFLMHHAADRAARVRQGVRKGRTSVVAWPLWRDGRMRIGAESDDLYLKSSGQRYLERQEGLTLWTRVLPADGVPHVVLTGSPESTQSLLRRAYKSDGTEGHPASANSTPGIASVSAHGRAQDPEEKVAVEEAPLALLDAVKREVESAILEVLKIQNKQHLDDTANLSEFGFDSIALTALAAALRERLGVAITTPIFFSYSTIAKLGAYLVERHRDELTLRCSPPRTEPIARSDDGEAMRASSIRSGDDTPDRRIAIIGMAGRFPKASSPEGLWKILAAGHIAISEVPPLRWADGDISGPVSPDRRTALYRGGFLDGVDEFDPLFFEISPREAVYIDPRQRLLLQETWHALEDAGYVGRAIQGKTCGVYVGVEDGDFGHVAGTSDEALLTGRHCGILAARISYFLDLKGPNLAINTACSSGLVALHHACRSLEAGDCELAVAASVNLLLSSQLHREMAKMGMLSPTGACHAFSERADGIVPSEAVVALVLKPLRAALRDGDRVHGIILSSHINCDGRTNGITAPNGLAQEELLQATYARGGIDPSSIEYVVSHGTGTKLGDPVEVNALTNVFSRGTSPRRCVLGSVKANLGHTCAASGLVSLVSGLLALDHETIPGTPDCADPNALLALDKSPFLVDLAPRPWPRAADKRRRVAVSSFGMSGTNAHVVLEEPPPSSPAPTIPAEPLLFVLSAKNRVRLGEVAENLRAFLADPKVTSSIPLRDVAYTLQIGRAGLESRAAFVATEWPDVVAKLDIIRGSSARTGGVQVGTVSREPKAAAAVADAERQCAAWALEGRWDDVGRAWVSGVNIDWNGFYHQNRPRRVSLPTYPFSRDRQPVPEAASEQKNQPATNSSHRTCDAWVATVMRCDPAGNCTTVLHATDDVLAGHVVQGALVLPGVAYLEMVRAAAEQRTGRPVRAFTDIAWLRPLTFERDPKTLTVRWVPSATSIRGYEVVTTDRAGADVMHAKGNIEFTTTLANAILPIAAIRERCVGVLEAEQCYRMFASSGIDYGLNRQCLRRVYYGDNEALAEIGQAAGVASGSVDALTSRLLDAALQGIVGIGLSRGESMAAPPKLPYAAARVSIPGHEEAPAWAHLRASASANRDDAVATYDVDVCDSKGHVLVSIERLSFLAARGQNSAAAAQTAPSYGATVDGVRLFEPVWTRSASLPPARRTDAARRAAVVPAGLEAIGRALLEQSDTGESFLIVRSHQTRRITERHWEIDARDPAALTQLAEALRVVERIDYVGPARACCYDSLDLEDRREELLVEEGGLPLFRLLKGLQSLGRLAHPIMLRVLVCNTQRVRSQDAVSPWGASAIGLAMSLRAEYEHLAVDAVDVEVDSAGSIDAGTVHVLRNLPIGAEALWAVRDGAAWTRSLRPVHGMTPSSIAVRKGAVVLIIGGAGGIGFSTALHLCKQAGARLALVGRRAEDDAMRARLKAIVDRGGEYLYLQADATDPVALRRAYETAKARFGEVNGIVHSVLALNDRSLAFMDEATFRAPLECKMLSAINLRDVVRDDPVEFVLFHASVQSLLGNAGQSNYAAGCTFADAFARHWRASGGPVRAVLWGYWGEVGIVASADYRRRMLREGLQSISVDEGMRVVDQALRGPIGELVAVTGTEESLARLGVRPKGAEAASTPESKVGEVLAVQKESLLNHELEEQDLERFGQLGLVGALQRVGLFRREGEKHRYDEVASACRITPRYQRFLDAALHICETHGYIERVGHNFVALPPVADPSIPSSAADLRLAQDAWTRRRPALAPSIRLLVACLEPLPAVLAGEVPATEILFPQGSDDLVRAVYQDALNAQLYNELTAKAVEAVIERCAVGAEQGRKLTVVEIGAGTGSATSKILERLARYSQTLEYHYTDVSKAFTVFGESHFRSGYPFVRCAVLDVRSDIGSQGFASACADVVVASNVLHATPSVRKSVENVGTLLRKGGHLVLNEVVCFQTFTTLTFGLLDGWWAYADGELRLPFSPLLSRELWATTLKEHGFGNVSFLGRSPSGSKETQSVIVAEQLREGPAVSLQVPRRVAIPSAVAGYAAPATHSAPEGTAGIEGEIVGILSEKLRIGADIFDVHVPFAEYGVDSIVAVRIVVAVNEKLRTSLQPTDLFNYTTTASLARHIAEKFPQVLEGPAMRSESPPAALATPPPPAVKLESASSDIAVIGIACQFPGAKNVREFWQNIASGRDSVVDATEARWASARVRSDEGTPVRWWAGLLADIDLFDAAFFNISPREARLMDPQQRLFLMEAWRALEDAGYAASSLSGARCGVFVGCSQGDYDELLVGREIKDAYRLTGNSLSILAARTAYHLNLKGPTLAIDTACSSSLVAIHLACESLRSETSDVAIAGGVYVMTTPKFHELASGAQMLSPTGRCRAFSAEADGFVPSEGVGVVVLKRLPQAVADGDHVYGVIRGSAINQDGKTSGITAPNGPSQTALECEVYDRFGLSPDTIEYVEAHGTGTKLGDPIEIGALTESFRRYTKRTGFCAIGSVKTNIGHSLTAAGVAGILKILLAFQNEEIPPSIHFERPNDFIDFASSPFFVNTERRPWNVAIAGGRRAAVSSFGFSGTNAHLVLESHDVDEARAGPNHPSHRRGSTPQLAVISARSRDELSAVAAQLGSWCRENARRFAGDLTRITYTLQTGREAMSHRAAFRVLGIEDLAEKLEQFAQGRSGEGVWAGTAMPRSKDGASSETQLLISRWTSHGDIEAVARHWVAGGVLNWHEAYPNGHPRRIPLPTYPFAMRRFWFDDENGPLTAAVPEGPAASGIRGRVALLPLTPPSASSATGQGAPDGIAGSKTKLQPPATVGVAAEMATIEGGGEGTTQQGNDALVPRLRALLAEVLFLNANEIGSDDKFSDLGLDSITGVEWTKQIGHALGTKLKATLIYDHPTLSTLSRHLTSLVASGKNGMSGLNAGGGTSAVVAETAVKSKAPQMGSDALAERVRQHVASVLYLSADQVPLDAKFLDLGLDSITGVELTKQLGRSLGYPLKATVIYDHPTVALLTSHLLERVLTAEQVPGSEAGHVHQPPTASRDTAEMASIEPRGIAIIGMAARFAKARNVREFWQRIASSTDVVAEVPASRFSLEQYFDPDPLVPGKTYSKWLAALDDIDRFDAEFFNISPREAEVMDPQQRLFLEEAWGALEDAGYGPDALAGTRSGVYVGVLQGDYVDRVRASGLAPDACALLGKSNSVLAARLAYLLNLKGASIAIDTACSSSLVAIHEACESLLSNRNDLVIAGGVYVSTTSDMHVLTSKANMLSPSGRCRVFDDDADGFVIGEGVGVVVLKRLADALRDRDHIHGVIKATAVNQDGATNGLTAPSLSAQREVELETYRKAGISPADIQLVEAHGTGTKLGDPIEVGALTEAFRQFTDLRGYCALGSVKTQIGHTLAAAGIAGVIKVLLALKHRTLPPTLHCETPNRHIDLAASPFYVNTEPRPWNEGRSPRLAAVSSFGFSGTNAHLVIEEAPSEVEERAEPRRRLAVLSGRDEEAVRADVERLRCFLQESAERGEHLAMRDVAFTLQFGRKALRWRLAIEASECHELEQKLAAFMAGDRSGCVFGGSGSEVTGKVSGDLQTFASAWVRGERPDWAALYRGERPRRVPLPVHEFDGDRYWVPEPLAGTIHMEPGTTAAPASPSSVVRREEPLVFEEQWVDAPFEPIVSTGDGTPRVLLYFGEERDAAAMRAAKGAPAKSITIHVSRGEGFAKITTEKFATSPFDVDSLTRLLREAAKLAPRMSAICRWAENTSAEGIRGTHALLSAIRRSGVTVDHVLLVGRRDASLAACYDGAWIAWKSSVASVLPSTTLTLLYHDENDVEADVLWSELGTRQIIEYRGEQRRILKPRRVQLPAEGQTVLRRGGAYLIAGGAGALGMVVAEHLASTYRARIGICGRADKNSSIGAKLDRLTKRGAAKAIYVPADLSDTSSLKRRIDALTDQLGPLRGVIHAAGVFSPQPFHEKTPQDFARGLAAKIDGTIALDRATAGADLDFFCLFSSSAAMLGDFGAGDYGIGNRFENAYANYREFLRINGERTGRSVVIHWPLWEAGGLGAKEPEERRMYLHTTGQRALANQEAVATWEALLATDGPRLVLAGEATPIERQVHRAYGVAALEHLDTASHVPAGSIVQNDVRPIRGEIRAAVAAILKLGAKRLRDETSFAEFGFDSITLTELARRLGERFGVSIPPTVLFSHSSIGALSEHIAAMPGVRTTEELIDPSMGSAERTTVLAASPRRAARSTDIAVIGISGRFPGADSVTELWDILSKSRCVVTEVPERRWNSEEKGSPIEPEARTVTTTRGGFLADVHAFDPLFFEISPLEAETIDPRQRLLLEATWHALEDAGHTPARLHKGRCGVFVGVEESDFAQVLRARDGAMATGHHNGVLAARISYFLNLKGPNLAINTACSSGLVALHYACESIRNGESDIAIAAGVNLLLTSTNYRELTKMGMLSPSGVCYAFDARAEGMVPGEAVAVLVLKPLEQAVADGDLVHAVIRGSGINHDGRTNGITAPSGMAQTELIRSVLQRANVEPNEIDYVIAHGTGTKLGDPVEFSALLDAFGSGNGAERRCAIGSFKANLGHTFAASGLVSAIGGILALEHQAIPPAVHFEKENPYIALDASPFRIARTQLDWQVQANRRRLFAVSAFGMSGTNAHVIFEEAGPTTAPVAPTDVERRNLFVLSAKSNESLDTMARHLADYLRNRPVETADLRSIAFTLQVGREALDERLAIVAESKAELLEKLERVNRGELPDDCWRGMAPLEREPSVETAGAETSSHAQLTALAQKWVRGLPIRWESLYEAPLPPRVRLPLYPFAREDCSGGKTTVDGEMDAPKPPPAAEDTPELRAKVVDWLRSTLADTLKIALSRIRVDVPLERYGIDSLRIVALTTELERQIGPLSKTLFFEHQTIGELADYFVAKDHDRVASILRSTPAVARPVRASVPANSGRAKQNAAPSAEREPIAIVGLAGRYPKARDLEAFWENLVAGRDCIEEVPKSRWNHEEYYDPAKGVSGKTYGRWGGFLDDVDQFDPLFFNISPKEAELMDPQERLFLETVWEAIEDAGYTRQGLRHNASAAGKLEGNVGVYVGVMYQEYPLLAAERAAAGKPLGVPGNPASIANRISYFCDLHGPSIAVDSMCSSSLTAIHLASEAIHRGECQVAIAGGVNISIHPNKYLVLGQGRFISSRGRCESFGVGGDGYVPSEGVGAVVLKPLSRALQDRDHVYGVVRGSSLNHGGKTNGYTVPNPRAQAEVIKEAIERSGVEPRAISYVEAHGTGTALGDPIEMAGLCNAFESFVVPGQRCALGSVKSNVGHCEAAAGIAGLTKILLQMRNKTLVPSIHAETLNPKIDFDRTPFRVQRTLEPWNRPTIEAAGEPKEYPRIAGLSSFGAGGSNAHLVVEEYIGPDGDNDGFQNGPVIIPLSAKSPEILRRSAGRLAKYLDSHSELVDHAGALERIAFTLQTGREPMRYRAAWMVRSATELMQCLERFAAGEQASMAYQGEAHVADDLDALSDAGEPDDQPLPSAGNLDGVAGAWVTGRSIDWRLTYAGRQPRRLSLPTYPFAHRRCWIPSAAPASIVEAGPPRHQFDTVERIVDQLLSESLDIEEAARRLVELRPS